MPKLSPEDVTPQLLVAGVIGMCIFFGGLLVNLVALVRTRRAPLDWDVLTERIAVRPWTWRDAIELTLILTGLHGWLIALFSLASLLRPAALEALSPVSLVIQTLFFQGAGLGVILVLLRQPRHSWWRSFGWDSETRRSILQGVLFYLGAMPTVIVVALLYRAILDALGYPIEPQSVVQLFLEPSQPVWLKVYLGLLAVTGAPLVEELLFRGIGMPILIRRLGPAAAVVGCSVLFALLHLSIPALAPLFTIGAAFAVAYLVTGRILVPIVMHACFNGVSLVLMLLVGDTSVLGLL